MVSSLVSNNTRCWLSTALSCFFMAFGKKTQKFQGKHWIEAAGGCKQRANFVEPCRDLCVKTCVGLLRKSANDYITF